MLLSGSIDLPAEVLARRVVKEVARRKKTKLGSELGRFTTISKNLSKSDTFFPVPYMRETV